MTICGRKHSSGTCKGVPLWAPLVAGCISEARRGAPTEGTPLQVHMLLTATSARRMATDGAASMGT